MDNLHIDECGYCWQMNSIFIAFWHQLQFVFMWFASFHHRSSKLWYFEIILYEFFVSGQGIKLSVLKHYNIDITPFSRFSHLDANNCYEHLDYILNQVDEVKK